jgi:hypothetical protein
MKHFFSNDFETRESHELAELKTHYYRARYDDIKDTILRLAKERGMTVRSIDDKHKEIYLQSTRFHLILILVNPNPAETAVDMKITTYYFIGMKRGIKIISDFYQYLDKKHTFKGVGLYR